MFSEVILLWGIISEWHDFCTFWKHTHYIIHYLLSYSSLAAKLDNVIAAILFRGSCKNSATQRKGYRLGGQEASGWTCMVGCLLKIGLAWQWLDLLGTSAWRILASFLSRTSRIAVSQKAMNSSFLLLMGYLQFLQYHCCLWKLTFFR